MIYNLPRAAKKPWPTDLDTALEFTSPEAFSISTTKNWDGKIEYTNGKQWETWDGGAITSGKIGNNYCIYLRGTGNSKITGDSYEEWSIVGTNIACNGDIDLLLDYSTVKSGNRPAMADTCYAYMFYGCTRLTAAPSLPATTLADNCYYYMFNGCTSLTAAPSLPATTLAYECYAYMFYGCTSLTAAPSLPATTLAGYCYAHMFESCTILTSAPSLPATTLADNCYYYMFKGCTSLTSAPSLPATTLAYTCYAYMFYGCTSLTSAPSLPATTLTSECYDSMFRGCTEIKLSTTASGTYTKSYRIPKSGTGTTASYALNSMFANTGGTFKGTPAINTTYYLDKSNTISGGGAVTKKKIKFTIKLMFSTTTQYEAEEGMTWEQWVNSAYNTDGFFIRTYSSTLELVDKTQNFALTITSTDTITADKTYTMGPAMIGPDS